MTMNSEDAKTYLAGAYQFKVIEIEVYKVVFAAPTVKSMSGSVSQGLAPQPVPAIGTPAKK